jgi:16S rRNA U516 pseudouridylate synthase RsuA-like enzyme
MEQALALALSLSLSDRVGKACDQSTEQDARVLALERAVARMANASDVAPDTMLTESWWPRVREPTELGTYFILHKPRDVLTSRDDSTGRATVYDCVSEAGFAPVGHVGRLDYETTGLLLFTDDSQLNLAIRDPVFKGLATIPGCPSTSMRKVRR